MADAAAIRRLYCADENALAREMLSGLSMSRETRARVCDEARQVAAALRAAGGGLSARLQVACAPDAPVGAALMRLVEAWQRTPDAATRDALLAELLAGEHWRRAAADGARWARATPLAARLARRPLCAPAARAAVSWCVARVAARFVLGRGIDEALRRTRAARRGGALYSFDMLGEGARTAADAERHFFACADAVAAVARAADPGAASAQHNSGVSIKLSALHPRFEHAQRARVLAELAPRVAALARRARAANINLTIDAEELDRLELTLDLFEAVWRAPELRGWDGFGVAVQAYAHTAPAVVERLCALARRMQSRLAVRLVKGAYWDAEIKTAQALGLRALPVFTRKATTDLSYLFCAQKLLENARWAYPQFATHNAHSVCAVRALAPADAAFEFQRLHGMGAALHAETRRRDGRPRRVYAPVGARDELLAYLMRRLLENGANGGFVRRLADASVPLDELARDPLAVVEALCESAAGGVAHPAILPPPRLYRPARRNAAGRHCNHPADAAALDRAMAAFAAASWRAGDGAGAPRPVRNPCDGTVVGEVVEATAGEAAAAVARARDAFAAWSGAAADERAAVLERAADLYEETAGELLALLVREAGRTREDAVAELREAVDFLRYYAAAARRLPAGAAGRGVVACISPWNFPLAIFTGQVAGALAAGNTVAAKPAEQTPLVAARAARLLRRAGLPRDALALVCGAGETVGQALAAHADVAGACFTGSLATAAAVDRALARAGAPDAPLIAETGGVNAMIVDSTALPEQATRDVVASAFRSAGQRCSALRVLCVQEEAAAATLAMVEGAARELRVGDPWDPATDVGPLIDAPARRDIAAYCERMERAGRLLFKAPLPRRCDPARFVAPCAFRVERFEEVAREVFGPVLHVLTFRAAELDALLRSLDAAGYGLTLGAHSRVRARVRHIRARTRIGNMYVNRGQIGATVGAQPFGGERLSGTGPKAGGPLYVARLSLRARAPGGPLRGARAAALEHLAALLPAPQAQAFRAALRRDFPDPAPQVLPGPAGERNTWSLHPRGTLLCLGPGDAALAQAAVGLATGNRVLLAARAAPQAAAALRDAGVRRAASACRAQFAPPPRAAAVEVSDAAPDELLRAAAIDLAALDGDAAARRRARILLADRPGARARLLQADDDPELFMVERARSEDTTVCGGNAALFAAAEA